MKIHIEELKEDLTLVFQDGSTKTYEAKKRVPRSWHEFVEQNPSCNHEFFVDSICGIEETDMKERQELFDRNLCKTREEAEAFLALMQLRMLWHAWCEVLGYTDLNTVSHIYGFKPGPDDETIVMHNVCCCGLFFKSKETAVEFRDCFKDLLEKARILL